MLCLAPFTETLENPMVKHHIRYYPEAIAWVHYKCHNKIHNPDNPITTFIQYDIGDPEKFQSEKKVLD
tara:strand:+ start:187 stop:390 length:204 start_codon:yes stop_codon:yes gene_type:complete